MKVEFLDNEKEEGTLKEVPTMDTPLKKTLVDYVGDKKNPENDEVTVSMIIDVVAEEFPELIMAIAEENWIRGYQQALTDVSIGEKLHREEMENNA